MSLYTIQLLKRADLYFSYRYIIYSILFFMKIVGPTEHVRVVIIIIIRYTYPSKNDI